MNLLKLVGTSALFFIVGSATLLAQSAATPGELAGPPTAVVLPSLFAPWTDAGPVPAKMDMIASVEDAHTRRVRVIWIASIFAVLAGTAADAASSWHMPESNSLLASSNGTFGLKGAAIKGGITTAVLAPQIIFRKHSDWHTAFAIGNFVDAGVSAGAAVHNWNVNDTSK